MNSSLLSAVYLLLMNFTPANQTASLNIPVYKFFCAENMVGRRKNP